MYLIHSIILNLYHDSHDVICLTISIIHPHHPHLSMHARLWANGINYIDYQMTKPLAAEDVSPQPDSGHPCPFGWFGVESSGSGRGTWPQHPHLRSSVWILDQKWSKHKEKYEVWSSWIRPQGKCHVSLQHTEKETPRIPKVSKLRCRKDGQPPKHQGQSMLIGCEDSCALSMKALTRLVSAAASS